MICRNANHPEMIVCIFTCLVSIINCNVAVNIHMSGQKNGVEKKRKYKRKNKFAFRLFVFMLFVVLTIAGCYVGYTYVMDSSKNVENLKEIVVDREKGTYVEIPLGAGTSKIADILAEKGLVKYPYIFKMVSKINGYDGKYQAGTHIVSKDLNYDELMRVLSSKPESVKVTIPEGSTYKQAANILYKAKLISKEKFDKACTNEKFEYEFMKKLPEREYRLEGYLFPDTYEFDMKAGEAKIISIMLENFNRKFKKEYYERAKELGMTVDQIITLASIIEKEAMDSEERYKISGVFYNRLKKKMMLQSCATIQYIFLNRDGKVKEKISIEDTQINDPYNTYVVMGLPPGPICCPSEEAIKAALYPEQTEYMYFVAKGDGTHEFSKTLAQHEAAKKKYGVN